MNAHDDDDGGGDDDDGADFEVNEALIGKVRVVWMKERSLSRYLEEKQRREFV